MDANKLENIISGYGISADDAAWLRELPLEQREAEPRAVPESACGHLDDGCKQIVSAMQSMRDRLGGFLAKTYGDQFDGDIDTMLEAINFMKTLRVEARPAPVAVPAGYALVPVEPTEAMLDAGHAAAWRRIPSCFDMTDAEIVYRAMLAAAVPRVAGPWLPDEHAAYRECNGKRVAFIEKTPRVLNDNGEWEYGPKGCGQLCGKDPDSRAWCDAKLRELGYVLQDAPPAALAVPAANVTPMRQPRADLARLVESINAAVYANGDGLSVTEAIGALELAKLELLKEQER